MGEAELILSSNQLIIRSRFIFYGDAADEDLAKQIATDIEFHWNDPRGTAEIKGIPCLVRFEIAGLYASALDPETVWYNTDPKNNYFRIEAFSDMHISFVDGIHCNTGYFKLDNLLKHSTTAAHEYGHTLGLDHPVQLDIRGRGQPGIMYPRGTICDPLYQYDPAAVPAGPGGTIDPFKRKVLQTDIDGLKLHKRRWNRNGKAVIGDFSGIYHDKHPQPPLV